MKITTGESSLIKRLILDLRTYWRLVVIILTPIILCPLPVVNGTRAASCAYVVLIMVVFWLTESLPLAVTALIPLVLFPLFGILPAKTVAMEYMKDGNWVLFGSITMALAVEHSQLHHRIGLFTLVKIGSSPRRLMLGFMVSTCFLSMWLVNTAATALMVPLALAVIEELIQTEKALKSNGNVENGNPNTRNEIYALDASTVVPGDEEKEKPEEEKPKLDIASITDAVKNHGSPQFQRMCKGLLLSIAYSANIGGTGTLTGTSSNFVLVGQLDSVYKSGDTGLTFASWMAFSVPQMIIILLVAWLWLQTVFIGFGGCTKKQDAMSAAIGKVLQGKYKALKPMRFAEISVLVIFIILVLLWLFRKPGFIRGWGDMLPSGYVSDGTPAMMMSLLLFIVPRGMPRLALFSGHKHGPPPKPMQTVMTWSCMQKEFPWGIVLLVGGGYAMAKGVTCSGLGAAISQALQQLNEVPTFAFLTISVILVTFITEFSSNVAIATIFVPIGFSVAEQMHIHPLYVTLSITIACSFAFMLPVASPPNAIVFSSGLVRVVDMAMAGFVMNIICMAVLLINSNTYGCWLFQCHIYPEWAQRGNQSTNGTPALC